jgi:hypothetical protein
VPNGNECHIGWRLLDEVAALFDGGTGAHGMIGTEDVEFFGEPSINLSE